LLFADYAAFTFAAASQRRFSPWIADTPPATTPPPLPLMMALRRYHAIAAILFIAAFMLRC
jgi:hypothetical protein